MTVFHSEVDQELQLRIMQGHKVQFSLVSVCHMAVMLSELSSQTNTGAALAHKDSLVALKS